MARDASRVRLGAASFAIAGVLFLLYPAIRPFSDETSLQGAAAFASTAWIVAHVLAMLGFILVTLGLLSVYRNWRSSPGSGSPRTEADRAKQSESFRSAILEGNSSVRG